MLNKRKISEVHLRLFFTFFTIVFLLILCSVMESHALTLGRGTCGDHLTYVLDTDGTMTISGTGEIRSFNADSRDSDYRFYRNSIRRVIIENGTTAIGDYAFGDLSSMFIGIPVTNLFDKLESIIIPNTVTRIGNNAFRNCDSLISITLPNSVKTIGTEAFYSCSGLESITFNQGLISIGARAFADSDALGSVSLPDTVTGIGDDAFGWCSNLRVIQILNKRCPLTQKSLDNSTATIYAYPGSTAQTYAKTHGRNFVALAYPAHKHTYVVSSTVPATTKKDGKIIKVCSFCDVQTTTTVKRIKKIYLTKKSFTYNGKALKPTVVVKNRKGKALHLNTDYSLKYSKGRKTPGSYTVKVIFKGNYSGSKKLNFKILPKQVTGLKQQKKPGINIEWKSVPGVSYYEVYYMMSGDKKFQLLGKPTDISFGNSNIAKNTRMTFKVRAVTVTKNGKVYKGSFSSELTAVGR